MVNIINHNASFYVRTLYAYTNDKKIMEGAVATMSLTSTENMLFYVRQWRLYLGENNAIIFKENSYLGIHCPKQRHFVSYM